MGWGAGRPSDTVPEPGVTADISPHVDGDARHGLGATDLLLALGIAFVFAALYSASSVLRHLHFETAAFDLGIFDQAIWHYSNLEAPASTIRGYDNLLGDHFHPILVLAAPSLWLWDDARALLVLQSILLAVSALPVYWVVRRHFETVVAVAWSVAYLLSWGLIGAARFDFHEVAFAVPLIALGCALVVEGRMTAALVPIAALALVKEDLALLIVAFGALYLLRRRWLAGAALVAGGVAWFLLVTKAIIPAFGDGRSFRYWSYPAFGDGPAEAVRTIVTHPWRLLTEAVNASDKLSTGFFLLAPFAFLSLASPLVVLLVPLVAERVYSDNPSFWTRNFHYTATAVPIVAIAAVDGLRRLRNRFGIGRRAILAVSGLLVVLAVLGNYPRLPFEDLARGSTWRSTESERVGRRILAAIPPDAAVITQDALAPHLTHRDEIWVLPIFPPSSGDERGGVLPPFRARTEDADVVVVNVELPLSHGTEPAALARYLRSLPDRGFGLTRSEGPWLVYENGAAGQALLSSEAKEFFARYPG